MPNNQELRLQQTQMLSHQDFRLQQTQCSQTKISGVHKQFHPPNKSLTTTRQRGAYLPEHKIGVFVRFWGLEALFSGFSSTKSAFLCSIRGTSGIGKRKSNLPAIHRAYFQNANTS